MKLLKFCLPLLLSGGVLSGCATSQPPTIVYHAMGQGLPFSEVVQVGDFWILSGQLGNVPGTLKLAEGGMPGQAKQTMDNIGAVLAKHGLGFEDVVKCTVMLEDMADWPAFNEIYAEYFDPDRLPARSAFGADGLGLGALLEVECWAYESP